MSPPQGGGSQRHLRPYQVTVHQDSAVGVATGGGNDDDLVAKTDALIRKLAEASGRSPSAGEASPTPGPSRKFRCYPQSYHDQPYEDIGGGSDFGSGRVSSTPDIASPYRGGDGRDAPPGFDFAVKSYQHGDGGSVAGAGGASDATEAARQAEEEALRMAEATKEMTGGGESLGGGYAGRRQQDNDDGMSAYVSEGVHSCVRSMLSCLNTSAEGTLLGYGSAPEAGGFRAGGVAGTGSSPYVSNTIYGGFSDSGGHAPGAATSSSEKSGLLGSVMMR